MKFKRKTMDTGMGVDITQGVIWRQLLSLFFPVLFGTFFQQLYNTADAMIVGRFVGKQALGAVGGATGVLVSIITNLFVGLSSGTTVVVAQIYGAGKHEEVDSAVHTSMLLALIGGAGLSVVGLLCAPAALRAMDTPADVLPYALTYIRVILLGMVPSFIYNMGAGVLRAVGDTRRPVNFLIAACLTNVVLDILFVAGFHMGVFGAALATIISQTLSAVLIVLSLCNTNACYRLVPKKLRMVRGMLWRVVRVGLPAGLQSNMYAISNVLIQSRINSFGTDTVAAWTAHGKIDGFFWMILSAYGIAMTTFVGQNFGARKYDRMKESVKIGLGLAAGTAVVTSLFYCTLSGPLLGIFTDDATVIEIGRQIVFGMVPYYVTYVCIEILASTIRGCGDALMPMLMTGGGVCVLRIVWIFTLLPIRPELSTVLASYPISWVVTSVLFCLYYRFGGWLRRCVGRAGLPAHGEQELCKKN
ncbi:MATE family efflux transporter [Feifania hominis]|nr:MATE family efflux transporter [Feifania hominis]